MISRLQTYQRPAGVHYRFCPGDLPARQAAAGRWYPTTPNSPRERSLGEVAPSGGETGQDGLVWYHSAARPHGAIPHKIIHHCVARTAGIISICSTSPGPGYRCPAGSPLHLLSFQPSSGPPPALACPALGLTDWVLILATGGCGPSRAAAPHIRPRYSPTKKMLAAACQVQVGAVCGFAEGTERISSRMLAYYLVLLFVEIAAP